MFERDVVNKLNMVRGIFAILILIGHCGQNIGDREPLIIALIHKGNFVWVCFFFFISAWSIAVNYDNNDNYLKGFLKRKVGRLVLYTIEAQAFIYLLKYFLLSGEVIGNFLVDINWYVYEQILLYFFFYIVFTFCGYKKSIRAVVLFIMTFVAAIFFWLAYLSKTWVGWTYAYYFSILSFGFGIVFHDFYQYYLQYEKIVISCAALIALLSSYCIIMPKESFWGGIVLHNALGISFLVLLQALFRVYIMKTSYICRFFTEISPFIYLLQFGVIEIVNKMVVINGQKTIVEYLIVIIASTVVLAYFFTIINKKVSDRMMRDK